MRCGVCACQYTRAMRGPAAMHVHFIIDALCGGSSPGAHTRVYLNNWIFCVVAGWSRPFARGLRTRERGALARVARVIQGPRVDVGAHRTFYFGLVCVCTFYKCCDCVYIVMRCCAPVYLVVFFIAGVCLHKPLVPCPQFQRASFGRLSVCVRVCIVVAVSRLAACRRRRCLQVDSPRRA